MLHQPRSSCPERKIFANVRLPVCHTLIVSAGLALSCPGSGFAQGAANAASPGINLAVVAKASSSYVSGDTSVDALNDGATPRSSRDTRHGSYGNWPRTGTEWVQYEWSQPISTKQVDVYWWMDGQGVGAPKACRVLYWDGMAFVPVANPSGLGIAGNQFNSTTFDEVTTP